MSVLVDLIEAQISSNTNVLTGKILTRPELLYGDSVSVKYACDVDVGLLGRDPITDQSVVMPLKNVPIANNNRDVIYAEVGAAVTLVRSPSGMFEITGLSVRAPGTYTRIPVCLNTGMSGVPVDVGLSSRPLTLEELQYYPSFGITPFGAIATFRGSVLIGIS